MVVTYKVGGVLSQYKLVLITLGVVVAAAILSCIICSKGLLLCKADKESVDAPIAAAGHTSTEERQPEPEP
eukprot:3402406-Prymnesium_polylepis.1